MLEREPRYIVMMMFSWVSFAIMSGICREVFKLFTSGSYQNNHADAVLLLWSDKQSQRAVHNLKKYPKNANLENYRLVESHCLS